MFDVVMKSNECLIFNNIKNGNCFFFTLQTCFVLNFYLCLSSLKGVLLFCLPTSFCMELWLANDHMNSCHQNSTLSLPDPFQTSDKPGTEASQMANGELGEGVLMFLFQSS